MRYTLAGQFVMRAILAVVVLLVLFPPAKEGGFKPIVLYDFSQLFVQIDIVQMLFIGVVFWIVGAAFGIGCMIAEKFQRDLHADNVRWNNHVDMPDEKPRWDQLMMTDELNETNELRPGPRLPPGAMIGSAIEEWKLPSLDKKRQREEWLAQQNAKDRRPVVIETRPTPTKSKEPQILDAEAVEVGRDWRFDA
ncbi:MAG: hypothetical protein AAF220_08865 [Pseudomonadota bacterium]